MRPATFEVQIDRVLVIGPPLDQAQAQRLRARIEQEVSERITTFRNPALPFEGETIRIDLPDLAHQTVDWERRVAQATANAIVDALRGGPK
jgi:hypothetical protein